MHSSAYSPKADLFFDLEQGNGKLLLKLSVRSCGSLHAYFSRMRFLAIALVSSNAI
jgi:hypothetical protein